MNEACQALQTPIISGNVSFYNESQDQNIVPTPAIGMVGLKDKPSHLPEDTISEIGHAVLLLEIDMSYLDQHDKELKLTRISQWICDLKDLCHTHKVFASRIVKHSVGYTLCRLCCQPACVGIKLLDDIPLFSEKLYQVILVVDPFTCEYDFRKIYRAIFKRHVFR